MAEKEMAALRAGLYLSLAEALDPQGPPEWMSMAGGEWPLYEYLLGLSAAWPSAGELSRQIKAIGAEDLCLRRERQRRLFGGPRRPPVWPYESVYLNGRLPGPETWEVEKVYQEAGLAPAGAELPDHASLELAFLAAITGTGERNARLERSFLVRHARRWLPHLGRDLAHSRDEVYEPLGALLSAWFGEIQRHASPRPAVERSLPWIQSAEACTLCGFCVQACPKKALGIAEGETETVLLLFPPACSGCGQCEKICEFRAVKLIPQRVYPAGPPAAGWNNPVSLRRSPRANCRRCGSALVSQAELNYLANRLGDQPWLSYCQDCRFSL